MRQEQAKQALVKDFADFCRKIKISMENPTPQLQQEVIRLLVDHVVVGKDEIVIKHIVPADDNGRLLPGRMICIMCHHGSIMCQDHPVFPRRPLKNRGIIRPAQTNILHTDNVQVGFATQESAYDVVVEVFVGNEQEHDYFFRASSRS